MQAVLRVFKHDPGKFTSHLASAYDERSVMGDPVTACVAQPGIGKRAPAERQGCECHRGYDRCPSRVAAADHVSGRHEHAGDEYPSE